MHANAILLRKLFTGLNQHDHRAMAECYHPNATFGDIAFHLRGKNRIDEMWQMICEGRSKIQTTFEVVSADDNIGQVHLVDDYTFYASDDSLPSSGREVHNVIDSRFRFRDGLIIEHKDNCDARAWSRMALGGVAGFLVGRFRVLRSWKARQKLDRFLAKRSKASAR